jgi:parallel beta-helix repeat protein
MKNGRQFVTRWQPRLLSHLRVPAVTATVFLVAAINAHAATYYVAPTGNDGNSCSAAQSVATPKRTVGSGLSCLRAGDTLYLRAGVYAEKIDSNAQTIPAGTSWTSPVTIAAYPGEGVTLRYGGGVVNLAANYIQYLIFDRLKFDAARTGSCPVNDGCGVSAISLWGGANHIRIQDSEILNSVGQGITIFPGNGYSSDFNEVVRTKIHDNGTSDFDHGMYVTANNTLIDGNEIYNNTGWGISKYPSGDSNIIRNNRVHTNATLGKRGDGILLYGGSNNQAYNNVVWANDNGIGTGKETNSKIYNNTITGNRSYGAGVGSDTNTDIKNNILYNNGAGYFNVFSPATYTISTNLCSAAAAGCSVVGDPRFVDPAGANFHIAAGSPAVDAGIALPMVAVDGDGVVRPSGVAYDIGAYELGGLSTPAAPTNVRIVR